MSSGPTSMAVTMAPSSSVPVPVPVQALTTLTTSTSTLASNNVTTLTLTNDELVEYQKMLDLLGFFPDKILINTLTMIAEDYATQSDSAQQIYDSIRGLLVSPRIAAGRKLPLIYVMDSILKNAKGHYITLMEQESVDDTVTKPSSDATATATSSSTSCWVNVVYDQLTQSNRDGERQKLRRVLNTWKQFKIFGPNDPTVVDRLLNVFTQADLALQEKTMAANHLLKVSPSIRKQMQMLLDDMHEGIDELEKLSLERLAVINPDLLSTMKQTAEQQIQALMAQQENNGGVNADAKSLVQQQSHGQSMQNSGLGSPKSSSATIFGETRSPDEIALADEWAALNLDDTRDAQEMVGTLQHFLMEQTTEKKSANVNGGGGSGGEMIDSNEWVSLLACTSVCATQLTDMMQRVHDSTKKQRGGKNKGGVGGGIANPMASGLWNGSNNNLSNNMLLSGHHDTQRYVRKEDFTSDGLTGENNKSDWVIGRLYTEGMPFVSAADGRRFATQKELSDHLDDLFRINQASKSYSAGGLLSSSGEERGWYVSKDVWAGLEGVAGGGGVDGAAAGGAASGSNNNNTAMNHVLEAAAAEASTHLADETRSKCRICGINFHMVFDNEEGDYMYSNCREMTVVPPPASTEEQVLVHFTCLNALGSPATLTSDQILND
jgi:pre-mRNA cleavage complex 2 protein Pcf11